MHEGHTHDHKTPDPKILLEYMLEHNQQHAEELAALATKLETTGAPESAALLREALAAYETGNTKLKGARDVLINSL